jgi:hypothetical protein
MDRRGVIERLTLPRLVRAKPGEIPAVRPAMSLARFLL